ncbi:MAG: B3/B4 domain-containing protein [Candidatus Krumholzibacteriia bacterium]
MSAERDDGAGRRQLADGRTVAVAAELAGVVRCGVLAVDDVTVDDAPALASEMSARAAQLRQLYGDLPPAGIPVLGEARRLYRAAGVDPTRTRPSSEALLRRVLKAQPLPRVNGAVDAINLASLCFLLPIGLYDTDRVRGDVELRRGRAGEAYPGIRKGEIHLAGRLGLFDADGPFGSPTSDSARTSVDATTRRLLAVVFATADYPRTSLGADLELLAGLVVRHCGGRVVGSWILSRAA